MENTIKYTAWRVGLFKPYRKEKFYIKYEDALEEYNRLSLMFDNIKLIEIEITEIHEY